MSPLLLSECDPATREKVRQQIHETEGVVVDSTDSLAVRESISFGGPDGVHLTRSGLTFSRAVSIDEWTALGQKLKMIEGSVQFWIGDWLNYGEKTYGTKYFDAIATTGYDDGYLRNLASVARNVDLSHRCDNLSWTHHREVAKLGPDQQTQWLGRAEKDHLSVRELRTMIHPKPEPPRSDEVHRLRDWIKQTCPNVHAQIQYSVYSVIERLKTGDVKFDLQFCTISAEEVKIVCASLAAFRVNHPEPAPPPESPKKSKAKSKPAHWTHHEGFISPTDANEIYARLLALPWTSDTELRYGLSYFRGGKNLAELTEIPPFLTDISNRVAVETRVPVNYIQLHRFGSEHLVNPHFDPSDMTVPMITVGQERTFRYGGAMPDYWLKKPQKQRPVEAHIPEQESLLRHGDLLVFNGGRTLHSMLPAAQDSSFNRNGYDWRFSILFRWTTPAMREFGVGACNRHGHREQYRAAIKDFQSKGLFEMVTP